MSPGEHALKSVFARFGALVAFVLSGFDRLRFAGASRLLNHSRGVQSYLHPQRILFKDFPAPAEQLTRRCRQQTLPDRGDVPLLHRNSPHDDTEAIALDLARRHPRTRGRIAVRSGQESARTYRLRRNADGRIEPRKETTRCTHYSHYFLHEQFGLCSIRISTGFPFAVQVRRNGRRWLAQQLDNRGVRYPRRDNRITAVADVARAQQLLDEQVQADWPTALGGRVRPVHPLGDYLHQTARAPFYWMTPQSEWATDFVFTNPDAVAAW